MPKATARWSTRIRPPSRKDSAAVGCWREKRWPWGRRLRSAPSYVSAASTARDEPDCWIPSGGEQRFVTTVRQTRTCRYGPTAHRRLRSGRGAFGRDRQSCRDLPRRRQRTEPRRRGQTLASGAARGRATAHLHRAPVAHLAPYAIQQTMLQRPSTGLGIHPPLSDLPRGLRSVDFDEITSLSVFF